MSNYLPNTKKEMVTRDFFEALKALQVLDEISDDIETSLIIAMQKKTFESIIVQFENNKGVTIETIKIKIAEFINVLETLIRISELLETESFVISLLKEKISNLELLYLQVNNKEE